VISENRDALRDQGATLHGELPRSCLGFARQIVANRGFVYAEDRGDLAQFFSEGYKFQVGPKYGVDTYSKSLRRLGKAQTHRPRGHVRSGGL